MILRVNGMRLTGSVEGRYAHGGITLNGIQWVQQQPKPGFMTPAHWFDAAWIDSSVMRTYHRTPRVERLLKEGMSEHDAVTVYIAQMESLLDHVTLVLHEASSRGTVYANAVTRNAIDPELAVADSVGDDAPWFTSDGGVSLMFRGLGRLESSPPGKALEPSPREIARGDLKDARATFVGLARHFRGRGGSIIVDCERGGISSYSSPSVLDLTMVPGARRP